MANASAPEDVPRSGIHSLLDTDLYKLSMQSCILRFFPDVPATFGFTNRTPRMRFSRRAFVWLQGQVASLADLRVTREEIAYLREQCPYLGESYLRFLADFRLRPAEQVELVFVADEGGGSADGQQQKEEEEEEEEGDLGDLKLQISGTWVETTLYEIPLLALISETYFRFMDTAWRHDGQRERAREKGIQLLRAGCVFSEFGSRRRRDYHTQDLVIQGLKLATSEAHRQGWDGKLVGTSNVHFAMKLGIAPVGTVAHEWFMGVAAVTDDYEHANELALRYWVQHFGPGVLAIALTDTFGTPDFLKAFARPVDMADDRTATREAPPRTFAQIFAGVRQDSGDAEEYVGMIKAFYEGQGIREAKAIVFSDSLDVQKALRYKTVTEAAELTPSFGIGTFFTNDFHRVSEAGWAGPEEDGVREGKCGKSAKSAPLNIVIKLSSAQGRAAVKISDNRGKNTGDPATVTEVKRRLGYVEREWEGGDESKRWDGAGT